MRQVQLLLTDQLYDLARDRASQAGFANLDEFLAEVVADELAVETEDIDHRFTPEVVAELDRVSAAVRAGARTYSPGEIDEHFRRKSQAWRENRPN